MNPIVQRDLYLPPPKADSQSQAHELVRYWRAVNRHRLGIVLLVVAIGVLAAVYAYSLPPVYRGTTTLLLDPVKKKSVTNEEVYDVMASTPRDYYLTQIEIMKSRDYAERLVRVLNLTKHPDFDPRQRVSEKTWWSALLERVMPGTAQTPKSALSSTPLNEDELRESVIARVMGGITIVSARNTQLVKVSFDTHDPQLAE